MLLRSGLAALLIVLLTAGATPPPRCCRSTSMIQRPAGTADPRDRISDAEPAHPPDAAPARLGQALVGDRRRPAALGHADARPARPAQNATTSSRSPRDLRVDVPGRGRRKINDAYGRGGPSLALRTVQVTGPGDHHVVNVNFKGFRGVVNLFDCFYADIDRRYFHSNKGVPVGQRYDAIDLKPGYQRLCGNDALDYVRYRHTDSDITRSARQQDFLRAAKDQVSTSSLIDDRAALAREFSKATQTDEDLRSASGFIRLAKLALGTADDPIRQIPFPAEFVRDDETKADYVVAAPATVQSAVEKFLTGGGKAAATPRRASRRRGSVAPAELEEARSRGRRVVAALDGREERLGFPLRVPTHLTERGLLRDARAPVHAARPQRHRPPGLPES
jgi:LCP family protein required for cell wall assembly